MKYAARVKCSLRERGQISFHMTVKPSYFTISEGNHFTSAAGRYFIDLHRRLSKVRVRTLGCTAGIETDAAREGVSVCLYELLRMGIRSEHILIYNLELIVSKGYERTYSAHIKEGHIAGSLMKLEELQEFDSVFVGGGDCAVLCREMSRTGFDAILADAIQNGLVYVGISAGSMYAAGNMPNGLRLI